MKYVKDLKLNKAYNVTTGNTLIQASMAIAEFELDKGIGEVVTELAKAVATELIQNDPTIRETIRDYVREAIITVPTEVIRDAMRDVIREEMGVIQGKKGTPAPAISPSWPFAVYGKCYACGAVLNAAGICPFGH